MANTQVIVGLGSCGIAAGAAKTYDKLNSIKKVDNLILISKKPVVWVCVSENHW